MPIGFEEEYGAKNPKQIYPGFDSKTGIYHSLLQLGDHHKIPTQPDLDIATFVLSQFPHKHQAESRIALIDSVTNNRVTYSQVRHSIKSLATGLYHALGVRKGDVIFLLSPNSLLYPSICLAILSIGAVLTTANPLSTKQELAKQIRDSDAKLGIVANEEKHKLASFDLPLILTSRSFGDDGDSLSIEELIDCYDPIELPKPQLTQSDKAAILYSSGTTGTNKGVILTHANFIAIMTLLQWTINVTSAHDDVYLCFLPMFHIYGLAFFAVGLFCIGSTTVLMPRFEFNSMLDLIVTHRVNNLPAVPPVINALAKHANKVSHDLSLLRRVGSGAAPLSKELANGFRQRFPWVELRQGYGLTESCGAATFFVSDEEAKAHPGSCGMLMPSFSAKVVDTETGVALPPYGEGELCLKSPTVMKGYLGNEEATKGAIDSDGWLKTGDLCYFDEDGFIYIVDRIKELIKHNGYQVW